MRVNEHCWFKNMENLYYYQDYNMRQQFNVTTKIRYILCSEWVLNISAYEFFFSCVFASCN